MKLKFFMTSLLLNASVDLMILICMDKEDPNLYYGIKQHRFVGAVIKITGCGNYPQALGYYVIKMARVDEG